MSSRFRVFPAFPSFRRPYSLGQDAQPNVVRRVRQPAKLLASGASRRTRKPKSLGRGELFIVAWIGGWCGVVVYMARA